MPLASYEPVSAATAPGRPDDASRLRGVAAAVTGNALEFYDFTTYAFFAVIIGRTFFPSGDAWISLLASVATFGVGFLTRPIGGIFIGAYADRAGRKPAMMLTIGLMAVGMLVVALTPGYATIRRRNLVPQGSRATRSEASGATVGSRLADGPGSPRRSSREFPPRPNRWSSRSGVEAPRLFPTVVPIWCRPENPPRAGA